MKEMNENVYQSIKKTFVIEKHKNSPDRILFQNDDFTAFLEPEYIFCAYSEDGKIRYKAQSKRDLAEFIWRKLDTLKFMRNSRLTHYAP